MTESVKTENSVPFISSMQVANIQHGKAKSNPNIGVGMIQSKERGDGAPPTQSPSALENIESAAQKLGLE